MCKKITPKINYENTPFIIVPVKIKYLRINLTKDVKDYTKKTIKHCLKKQKTQRNGKTCPAHGLEVLILPK